MQREVEQSWEARSEALRRSRAADPEAAAAAEARMALARDRAIAAQREREERDAALLVCSFYIVEGLYGVHGHQSESKISK